MLLMMLTTLASACDWDYFATPLTGETVAADGAIMFEAIEVDMPIVTVQTELGDIDISNQVDRYCDGTDYSGCLDILHVQDAVNADTITVVYSTPYETYPVETYTVTEPEGIGAPPTPTLNLVSVEHDDQENTLSLIHI